MSFLAPIWLLLAGLAGAVFALHMFRRRQVEVPSTLIWRLLGEAGPSRPRLHPPKFSLPLVLQVTIVLLSAVALAQPMLGFGAAQRQHTIYIVDSSGSMRATDVAPSRFDAAVNEVSAQLSPRSIDEAHQVSVIAVGGRAQLVAARHGDAAAVFSLLGQISASDGTAAWSEVPPLLDDILRADETTRIVILTDGGDAAASVIDTDFAGVTVERRVIAGTDFANAGLAARLTPAQGPVNSWRVDGTVTFSGHATRTTVSVAFKPEDGESFLQWSAIDVAAPAAGEGSESEFSQVFEFPSAGTLSLSLTDDAGPADNIQNFVLHAAPRALRVLYLGDGNVPMKQALLAMPAVELFAGTALPADDRSFDLIIADGVTLPRAPSTNVLWLGSARLAGEAEPMVAGNTLPTGWNNDHPLSAAVDWSQVGAEKAYAVTPLAGAAVLLQAGNVPLIQARTVAAGREVRLAMDLEAGKWQEIPGFPVFVHNLVGWLGGEPGALIEPECIAGTHCMLEARDLVAPIFSPIGEKLQVPAGSGDGWLLDGADESFVPQRAGLYVIGEGPDARTLAVNPAAGESDLAPRVTSGGASGIGPAPLAIWWWAAAAVAVLLLIEAAVAGRGSEQFLHFGALRRGTPLAERRRLILGLRLVAIASTIAALVLLPLPFLERREQVVVVADAGFRNGDTRRDALLATFADNECSDCQGSLGLVNLGNGTRIAGEKGYALSSVENATADINESSSANVLEALETAAAMIAPGRKGRILLATDGNETVGKLASAVPVLKARGVAVDVLPLSDMRANDALIQTVDVPPHIFAGDAFPVDAIVFSEAAQTARVVVTAEGKVVSEKEVRLIAGRNHVEAVVRNPQAGTVRYEVSVQAPGDPTPENNRGGVVVHVAAAPRVAVITPQPVWGGYFAEALSVQGLTAEVMDPSRAPVSIREWLDYDAVALMNVPAAQLDPRQQRQIEELVRLHGRGLMILGGENSFGPGGYYGTPLEDLSPLSSRVPNEVPVAAIAFVIDRSGSMYAPVGGVSRLDIAKQATAEAIDLLPEETEVSVVMFNSTADAVIPIQPRRMLVSTGDTLAPLKPLGGTSLVVAVDEALNQLDKVDAPIRHIVAMSDGLSQPMAFQTILRRAIEMDVTLSIIAIGDVADAERLADVADRGGGVFHQTRDFRALPSIMAQEAMMLGNSPVVRRTAAAQWVDRETSFLAGIREQLPPIRSYVRTTAKPQAQVHVAVKEDDGELTPILASWAYGAGRVLSLATHGAGPGTADWAELEDYSLLWAQALRHFLSAAQGQGLHVSLDRSGDEVVVDVGLLDESGRPVSGGDVEAVLKRQGEDSRANIKIREVAPGHYSGSAAVSGPGLYDVTVAAGDQQATGTIDIAYPARLDFSRADSGKLVALSRATGGSVLSGGESNLAGGKEWSLQPSWQPWLLLVIPLLLGDLVIRYAPEMLNFVRPGRKRGRTN